MQTLFNKQVEPWLRTLNRHENKEQLFHTTFVARKSSLAKVADAEVTPTSQMAHSESFHVLLGPCESAL